MPDEKPKRRDGNYVASHATDEQMEILTADAREFQDSLSAAVRRAVVAYGKLKSRHEAHPAEVSGVY